MLSPRMRRNLEEFAKNWRIFSAQNAEEAARIETMAIRICYKIHGLEGQEKIETMRTSEVYNEIHSFLEKNARILNLNIANETAVLGWITLIGNQRIMEDERLRGGAR